MISPRDRRTLVLATSVIVSLTVLTRGMPAWRSWVSEAQAGAAEQGRASRDADALIAVSQAMRDTLRARNSRYIALAPALVAGNTPGGASATLASLVSGAASSARVKLGAVQIRPLADTGARRTFVRVGVHADVVGDIAGLTTFLATLERGPVRLRIRDLTITQADAAAPADYVEALHADVTVEGLAMARRGQSQ